MPEDKISRAKAATDSAVRQRDLASSPARKSIQLIVGSLGEIIGSESLRGLPNLASSSDPYRGVRVLATKNAGGSLPKDGREILCINMRGKLAYARYLDDLSVKERPLDLADVKAEWAEDIAEAEIAAIGHHLHACGKAEKRYAELTNLSERIVDALTVKGES